jgi:hypothetical protein
MVDRDVELTASNVIEGAVGGSKAVGAYHGEGRDERWEAPNLPFRT